MKAAAARKLTSDGRPETKALLALLRAPSPDEIDRLLDDVFEHRASGVPAARCLEISTMLRMASADELRPLFEAVKALLWQLNEAPSRPPAGLFLKKVKAAWGSGWPWSLKATRVPLEWHATRVPLEWHASATHHLLMAALSAVPSNAPSAISSATNRD